jgi:Arc/MetJ family transcription regulator
MVHSGGQINLDAESTAKAMRLEGLKKKRKKKESL